MDAEGAIRYKIAHPKDGMDPAKLAQRNTLLGIAAELLKVEADQEMDEAVKYWKVYKEMSK